jgi:hypothetical protein
MSEVSGPTQAYSAVADELDGRDDIENQRHVTVRTALLNCLLSDERVQLVFTDWMSRNKLNEKAGRLHEAILEFANLCGTDPEELILVFFDNDSALDSIEKSASRPFDFKALRTNVNRLCRLIDEFENDICTHSRDLGIKTLGLVRDDLKLDWPYICIDLLRFFLAEAISAATGMSYDIELILEEDSPVSDYRNFDPLQGEKWFETYERWIAEVVASLQKLSCLSKTGKRSRRPKGDGEHLRQYAEWYYLCEIKDPRVRKNSLARENGKRRSHIQKGIIEAIRLLNLSAHRFSTLPK